MTDVQRPVCLRHQQIVRDDRITERVRLVLSCVCAGEGCPFDPRREATSGHP